MACKCKDASIKIRQWKCDYEISTNDPRVQNSKDIIVECILCDKCEKEINNSNYRALIILEKDLEKKKAQYASTGIWPE